MARWHASGAVSLKLPSRWSLSEIICLILCAMGMAIDLSLV
jgi:hypothetical protein